MQTEDYVPKWKDSTSKALWSVVAINVLKVTALVYPLCVLFTQIYDIVEYSSSPFDSLEEMYGSITSVVYTLGTLSLLAFIIYAYAVKRFACSQVFWKDKRPIRQARSGIVILTISLAIGLLVAIAKGFSLALMVIFVCTWVMDIIAYYITKDGFQQLSQSPHFDAKAQRGAGDLKSAAKFRIISMVIPLIAAAILILFAVILYSVVNSAPPSYQTDMLDPFSLGQTAQNANNIYEATRTLGGLAALLSIISLAAMALLEILVIFLSINGWIGLHKGSLTSPASNPS